MLNDESTIKNACIYTRVSTEEQATYGYSLDSQLERLRNYCKAREWNIVGEYVDGGYSGRNIKRPEYQQMLDDIDKWDAVVVIKMDRIHRNQKNFLDMMNNFSKKHKEFVSMSESFDTSTAMGRYVMNIMALTAQLESEQTGERIQLALIQKIKKDVADNDPFMGHRVPFGYRWDPKKNVFIPVDKELDLVKQIFQLYIDGWTMRQIALKTGKANTTIKYFLHNCFYAGFERWCHYFRRLNDVDPIISVETFNKVQLLLRERCLSHKQYEPMLIKDVDSFKLDFEKTKVIPVINRAKHNYNF